MQIPSRESPKRVHDVGSMPRGFLLQIDLRLSHRIDGVQFHRGLSYLERATLDALGGTYDPINGNVNIDASKVGHWMKNGAQPTDTVKSLFKKHNVLNP